MANAEDTDGQDVDGVEWPLWLDGPERLQRLDCWTLYRLADALATATAEARGSLPLLRQAGQALYRLQQRTELDAAVAMSTAQRGLLARVLDLENVDTAVDAEALARDVAVAVRLQTLQAAAGLLQVAAGLAVASGRSADSGEALTQTVWLAAESAWLWQPQLPEDTDAEDVDGQDAEDVED